MCSIIRELLTAIIAAPATAFLPASTLDPFLDTLRTFTRERFASEAPAPVAAAAFHLLASAFHVKHVTLGSDRCAAPEAVPGLLSESEKNAGLELLADSKEPPVAQAVRSTAQEQAMPQTMQITGAAEAEDAAGPPIVPRRQSLPATQAGRSTADSTAAVPIVPSKRAHPAAQAGDDAADGMAGLPIVSRKRKPPAGQRVNGTADDNTGLPVTCKRTLAAPPRGGDSDAERGGDAATERAKSTAAEGAGDAAGLSIVSRAQEHADVQRAEPSGAADTTQAGAAHAFRVAESTHRLQQWLDPVILRSFPATISCRWQRFAQQHTHCFQHVTMGRCMVLAAPTCCAATAAWLPPHSFVARFCSGREA